MPYTDITFDAGTADTLSTAATAAANALTGMASGRSDAASGALEGFAGAYSKTFTTVCQVESQDRGRLAGALHDLAEDVGEAKSAAERERARLKAREQWEQQQEQRERDPFGLLTPTPSPSLGPGRSSTFTPLPLIQHSAFPIPAPPVSASFSASGRERIATGSSGGTSSATPANLRGFATSTNTSTTTVENHLHTVKQALTSFTTACSWAPVSPNTLISGWERFIQENKADSTWITGIADAFEKAGGGSMSNFSLSLVVASQQPNKISTLLGGELSDDQLKEALAFIQAHPEMATEAGNYIASQLTALNHDSDQSDIDRATRLANTFSANAATSAQILRAMGADKLLRTISFAASATYQGDDGRGLAEALRSVFRNGEPHMAAANPNEARSYARSMVEYLKSNRVGIQDSGNDTYSLSYLLRDSTLSTPFLGEMGNQLETMEKYLTEHDSRWGILGGMTYGGPWLFSEENKEAAFDPVASYMTALGKNPEASLQFFTGTGAENSKDHLSDEAARERQQYWIEQRIWGHDNFTGILAALDAASADPSNANKPESRGLATTLVSMLANRAQGEGSTGDKLQFYTDDDKLLPGSLSPEASKSLAHILGANMESVDYAVSNEDTPGIKPGDTINLIRDDLDQTQGMPVFDRDDLGVLIKAGVSTDEGFTAFRQQLSNYQEAHLAQVIGAHHGSSSYEDVLSTASRADAKLEGFFVKNLGDQRIEAGAEADERVQAWIDLGGDLAGEIPFGKVPVAGPLVEFLAGQGIDAGTEALSDSLASHERDAEASSNDVAERALSTRLTSITSSLYENGVITRGDVDSIAEKFRLDPDEVEGWFKNGFPSQATIDDDPQLQGLVNYLAGENLGTDDYRLHYRDQFRKYFE